MPFLRLHRGNQDFHFPIQLSDEILPKAIFYGTVVPLVTYFVVKKLIVDPFVQKEKEEDTDKKKEKYADLIAEKRRQAQSAVELMKETVERIREEEERKGGLIIVRAVYGKIISTDSGDFNESQCIDANIPLQVMVKNSSLILPETKSKVILTVERYM
ncbi:dnaJ homolog subfamily C member 11-like [Lingula anatina]|uniref:DnaJ homolog subfamily C member 11-like n=1 Tax=Lingula anatina TaxID=7574 RepID=A0A1S3J649_LINAN|nr:dnaJ homolog subfamily C member 11-like [Lingula anatina]|eukprot:XP_013405783.1 dnaJ homolog subfamily C member 11-like [Lingula anatina]